MSKRLTPINAVDGTPWQDVPGAAGPCPVNVTLSATELLALRDHHDALAREADGRALIRGVCEQHFHEARAAYFESFVKQVAPDILGAEVYRRWMS
jgi:hypothetical protein